MLHLLLSALARDAYATEVAQALAGVPHALVVPGEPAARHADIAFVTRDVTGLSTRHAVLPATQAFYDLLLGAPKLRWVHIHSAGADRPVYQALHGRGVTVTTSAGANAAVVAQTALMAVLALARRWPRLAEAQRLHRWAPLIAEGPPRDLSGQTAVIVGWGPIGQEIGRLLQAVGLRLVVVRRQMLAAGPGIETRTLGDLDAALTEADWLVLACPLTPETQGLIGAPQLGRLRSRASLINVARGEVVNEAALIDALRSGGLAGAFLDVFAHEPLPHDSPLWDLPGVMISPHSAGFSDGHARRVADLFLANLGRWREGRPLAHQVG